MHTLRSTAALIGLVFVYQLPGIGQQTVAPSRLKIIPLEGQNAVNYIPFSSVTAPVVEVRDENDRPVEGASVTFKLPDSGPGGTFEGGLKTQTTITDFRGQADTRGYTINNQSGRFLIEITARFQDRTGRFLMAQSNTSKDIPPEISGLPKRSSKTKWILLGLGAAAGAGLGIYFGTRGSSGPIGVSAGPVVFGGR